MTDRSPPFLIDYTHGGRRYSFALAAPESWDEAEAHLAAVRETGRVEGSDLVEIDARLLMQLELLADVLLARLSARGEAARLMEAGAAVLAAAATLATGKDPPAGGLQRARALAVRLIETAGAGV